MPGEAGTCPASPSSILALPHATGRATRSETAGTSRLCWPSPTGRAAPAGPGSGVEPAGLHVVIQRELPRMRPQADRVDLLGALVLDPRLDDVLCEDAALQQELVVGLERVQCLTQRAGHVVELRELLGRQLEQVDVDRRARVDPVLDPVEAGH